VSQRLFDLQPLLDPPARFPYFAAILTTAVCTALLWASATGDQFFSTPPHSPVGFAGWAFWLPAITLTTLQGPGVLLAAPFVAAILVPGLGPALPIRWQSILRGARWGGIGTLVLFGWPLFPAIMGSLLFLVWNPIAVLGSLALVPGGALRLMIPGIPVGALAAWIWSRARAG
jgi:hypothetical protein